jgi:ABC-2 family transporter protein
VTRFTWLQARTQTLVATGVLAALVVAAAITGVQLSHLYHSLVAHCQTGCDLATSQFLSHQHFMDHLLDIVALVVPAVLGIFWGAPLFAREFETGTFRVAWTQSITRSRWLITKLAVVALMTIAVAGVLTLTITWWYRAQDPVSTTPFAVFDRRGIAPIGYAVFAFAVGALVGAVVRRTVPAMASTLAVFVFARIATTLWVRPHLLSPVHKTVSLLTGHQFGFESSNGSALRLIARGASVGNGWTLSTRLVTDTGRALTPAANAAFMHRYCSGIGLPPAGPPGSGGGHQFVDVTKIDACRTQAARMFHLAVTYQPAGRYWTFQWLETGIFVVLALLAAVGCYWWVTRRSN